MNYLTLAVLRASIYYADVSVSASHVSFTTLVLAITNKKAHNIADSPARCFLKAYEYVIRI